jgi:glycosyltransferase involved in cell wall biosynthesis
MNDKSYVLITAARNEEGYIGQVLHSIVRQTSLPRMWIIVSDGSTDRTDEIVREFAESYKFISLLRLGSQSTRAFSSKAFALNRGFESIRHEDVDFVGFLDADISLDESYYESLLERFKDNRRLGVAGGQIFEKSSGEFVPRFGNSPGCVAGAIQLFRRECFEAIGGFIPLSCGGEDHIANVMAIQNGWEVRSFFDLPVYHHRPTGTAGTTRLRAKFRQGMEDYFMGYHPLFEIGKCIRRFLERPFLMGSVFRLCGYTYPALTAARRELPDDTIRHVKKEQLRRAAHRLLGL